MRSVLVNSTNCNNRDTYLEGLVLRAQHSIFCITPHIVVHIGYVHFDVSTVWNQVGGTTAFLGAQINAKRRK